MMSGVLRAPIMAAMSGQETTSPVTRALRLARMTVHLAQGLLTVALLFPAYSQPRRSTAVKRWSAALLRILGVHVHAHGTPILARPLMLVANHVSWLDIFALNAVLPVRFVAKSEIRRWPAIGWLSAQTGTLFIERGLRRDTARVNRLVAEAMRAGDVIAVFPEGTTTDGSHVQRFHSALLQPALIAGATVQPLALRFAHGDGTLCVAAAYDGDKSLWQTLLQIVAQPTIDAHLWFLAPLARELPHRRAVADAAQAAIVSHLQS